MLTPGFSLTATERVLPRLALDFLTASLDPRVTVSRALNTATRINSSGLVETVNANLPRFDFDPVTLVCKGLLIEETRINYCTYSEDFSAADWAKTSAGTGVSPSLTTNYSVAPDGNQTADRFIFDIGAGTTAGDSSKVTHAAFTGLANPHASSISIWFKSNTANNYVLMLADGYVASTTITVTPTWQRFTFSNASVSGTNSNLFFALQGNQGTAKYADISVWGGQFEPAAFATSYIPNLAAGTTTRNADAVTMTGTNFSDWYNATEGTMFFEGSTFVDQGAKTVSFAEISNGVSNSFTMTLGMFSASAALFAVVNTTTQANINLGAFSLNTVLRLTGAYKANSFAAAKNGNTTLTDTSGSIPAVSQLIIGQRLGGPYMNGHARKFFYWPQRLINAEVQAFSK